MLKKTRGLLYVILDRDTLKNRDISKLGRRISGAGVDLIQLRDKCSIPKDIFKLVSQLKNNCRGKGVKLIINDRLDLGMICGADGLHIGQDDIPLKIARKFLGKDKIVGVSCHSLGQALRAQRDGADYVSIGPVFATPTKPEYREVGLKLVSLAKRKLNIPFFAIGDISLANLEKVLSAGAENIAVCREVCLAGDPAAAVRRLKSILLKKSLLSKLAKIEF